MNPADDRNSTPTLCPTCGLPALGGFDGGKDIPYEYCNRVRYRPPLEPLRCNYYEAPPRWLKAAIKKSRWERKES